jgi:hypothetical protein
MFIDGELYRFDNTLCVFTKGLSLSKFDNEQSLKINTEVKYLLMFSHVFAKKHDQWKTSFTKYYN